MGFIDRILRMVCPDLGIDLGTANTLVAVQGRGVVLCEPTVVAVRRGTRTVALDGDAVGELAKRMIGRSSENIEVIRPLRGGVISDMEITETMLRAFIGRVGGRWGPVQPRVVIAVPKGLNVVEQGAVRNAARNAGAREVLLVAEPLAAALGAGLPIAETQGNMIVDIGGGTTEVAVISCAEIVCADSVRVAGDELDQAIIKHVRSRHGLLLGENTAEQVKIQIGCALGGDDRRMEVRGRDLQTSLPRSLMLTSEEIEEALRPPLEQIIGAIRMVLERTPPELANDLMDQGLTLTGGTSLLPGIDTLIHRETGLQVRRVEDPMRCVALGCAMMLERLDDVRPIVETGFPTRA